MGRKTRVVIHDAAIAGLVGEPGVKADNYQRAERVLEQARSTAPVASGEYRAKLHIEKAAGANGAEVLRITAGTDHDIYVEADTGNLTRALDAAAD